MAQMEEWKEEFPEPLPESMIQIPVCALTAG